MEPLLLIIILFGVAAMIGIYLLTKVLRGKKPTFTMAMVHTFFAVSSLSLLTAHILKYKSTDLAAVITFFFVGILGFFMMYKEFFADESPDFETYVPKPIALIHGFAAVAGFVLLLIAYFG